MFSRPFIITQILIVAAILCLFFLYRAKQAPNVPVYGKVEDFKLTNQDNKTITLADLKNQVWVADFVFTTCGGICPMMSKSMSAINQGFAKYKDVRMVSISVNPENDTPEALKAYSKKYQANDQWIFLTGPRDDIQKLATESFKVGDIKDIVFHSALFVLVDRRGRIRGYYDGTDKERMGRLTQDLPLVRREIVLPLMPTINASLNGLAGIFLFCGFLAIRRRNVMLHRKLMLSAFSCSVLFLGCYVYYHATTHLLTRYQGEGIWRGIYFFILGTHTPLAVLIVPFILLALRHALRGEFDKHTRITRKLFPAWMYVSVTGVVIYLMLYVFKPA